MVPLALELHRRDGCPESGILPYQEIDYDIERRRTSQPASGRHGAAAENHQTRSRCATQAPCCARQAKKAANQAKPAAGAREGSKAARVLSLLRRPDCASLKELMKATGRLPHSVRGFLSGAVAKRMGLKLVSAKSEDGERCYSVLR